LERFTVPSFEEIPGPVRRLILDKIESISQLETLLLLYGTPERSWTPDHVSTELRIDLRWAADQLALLQSRGFLVRVDDTPSYTFLPPDPETKGTVASLAACYADRRVAVIALLYSRPEDQIRLLSDAFRVRRET
jgi:hypothetical protein